MTYVETNGACNSSYLDAVKDAFVRVNYLLQQQPSTQPRTCHSGHVHVNNVCMVWAADAPPSATALQAALKHYVEHVLHDNQQPASPHSS